MKDEKMKIFEIDSKERGSIKKSTNEMIKNNLKEDFELPIYTSQILNIISNTGHATRPKYVGQMSDIVPEFIENFKLENDRKPTSDDWEEFYLKKHKNEYDTGYERLIDILDKYKIALEKLINDDSLPRKWYDKFLLFQNFEGFNHEAFVISFLKRIFKLKIDKFSIKKASPEDESKGIDYFIKRIGDENELKINVKPITYLISEAYKNNQIDSDIIIILYELKENKISKIQIDENSYSIIDKFSKIKK